MRIRVVRRYGRLMCAGDYTPVRLAEHLGVKWTRAPGAQSHFELLAVGKSWLLR